ncbi:MAG: sigma-70 family RNA polymerase sigma factor [Blastocatellia bacterium]|nr:sigma-70 family RNA polymerase sigma factor [Blastocatellia bacterium]MCS7156523.1 sigma-70 family RNA polymerase sigma factor [Blastocatellia bacterium]MCX7751736.1 sigma-70 family RNA polymerase sigma factor [Blastocatellia bacterium]MDW8168837.1 sigma-70 family RNA polymerase sigma factor [Acidobacteriota bacterium]MDW8257449.1 sigma-70 family RNA polymerase sigma factor [Acidobacteriota bacterium]
MIRRWRAQNHAEREFERQALEYLEGLYNFAMALTRDRTEAEDLVQETYLRAFRGAAQRLPTGDVKAWLFTIMRNIWINDQRRKRRQQDTEELDVKEEDEGMRGRPLADERHRPDVMHEQRSLGQEIRHAIESLPAVYREVIVLRFLEGFSYSQIAAIIGCPAGTVMSRISRARAELRKRLNHHVVGTVNVPKEEGHTASKRIRGAGEAYE